MSAPRVVVLHGVNLDQLGVRDPAHYGSQTLADLEHAISAFATEVGIRSVVFEQTNFEGEYVELLHKARDTADALILNPGAWTHYSWAIRDALEIAETPAVEVHLSDVQAREEWRQHSVIRDLCLGTVSGKGVDGYRDALQLLLDHTAAA
jgi:3-dehydroquinate dehydratase-2